MLAQIISGSAPSRELLETSSITTTSQPTGFSQRDKCQPPKASLPGTSAPHFGVYSHPNWALVGASEDKMLKLDSDPTAVRRPGDRHKVVRCAEPQQVKVCSRPQKVAEK